MSTHPAKAGVYLDTSALLKWYVNESQSALVRDFIQGQQKLVISRLTVVEIRCALGRRRRAGEITPAYEKEAMSAFADDTASGILTVEPVIDRDMIAADRILQKLRTVPLRTLDALHLGIASERGINLVATADHVMLRALKALDMKSAFFGATKRG